MKAIITIAALCAASAQAEFVSGNLLFERLNSSSIYDRGFAIGYILGVADTGQSVLHCAPENATGGQVRDMVQQALSATPSTRNLSADVLVTRALRAAWPCPERSRGPNL